ncbi:hypothetical protein KA089_01925 [Candidatus Woesebacteria bacterium]|nr:hypothetical protein [Candidatus Woesebacteria bacterium]
MSLETGNGSIAQYHQFFGERVKMDGNILSLEFLSNMGFNLEKFTSEYNLPETFWTALRYLINRLANISLSTVNSSEKQQTSAKLLRSFGAVTTQETIEPHQELSGAVIETKNELSNKLGEANIYFVAIIQQIKTLIVSYHQNLLTEIPNPESDSKVATYLNSGASNQSSETVVSSFNESKIIFSAIKMQREKRRTEILESLSNLLNFTSLLSRTIFAGERSMKTALVSA